MSKSNIGIVIGITEKILEETHNLLKVMNNIDDEIESLIIDVEDQKITDKDILIMRLKDLQNMIKK